MKLIKPNKISFLQRTYGLGLEYFYVTSPILFFDLLTGNILPENKQWGKVAKALGGEALDHGLPKTTGEVLLAGNAYASEKKTTEMQVSLKFGELQKDVRVFGERKWQRNIVGGARPSGPEEISKVPLTYRNAYGGENYELNPDGVGYSFDTPIPQIELMNKSVISPGKKLEPAGFMPHHITWPQRTKYHGNYKKKWFEKYFPAMAPDTNLRLFNCAPEDQQYSSFFRGDEKYTISGMHQEHPELQGQLPGVKARSFATYNGKLIEVPLELDTVWFMPDILTGALIFRGQVEVASTEAKEITQVMLGYENLDDSQKSFEEYKKTLSLRTDPKTQVAHATNERLLMPKYSDTEIKERAEKLVLQKQNKLEEILQRQLDSLPEGIEISDLREPKLTAFDDLLDEDIANGDFDMSLVLKETEDRLDVLKEDALAAADNLKPLNEDKPLTNIFKTINIEQAVEQFDFELLMPEVMTSQGMTLAEWKKIQWQQVVAQQMGIKKEDKIDVTVEAEQVLKSLALKFVENQGHLRMKDLTGADFSRLIFRNLDFSSSILSFSNLTGTKFVNCKFIEASFFNANLTDCIFEQCEMQGCELSGVIGSGCKFLYCALNSSKWRSSQLSPCSIDHCNLQDVMFLECDFQYSIFIECNLLKNTVSQCKINDCDFFQCQFRQVTFSESSMQLTRWHNSQFDRSVMQLCQLQQASFIGIKALKLIFSTDTLLPGVNFMQVKFEQSSFRNVSAYGLTAEASNFISCDFAYANMQSSTINNSCLVRCIATETDFTDSQLSQCNCYHSNFRQIKLINTKLNNIDFLEVDLMWAQFQKTSLSQCFNLSKVAIRDQNKRANNNDKERIG